MIKQYPLIIGKTEYKCAVQHNLISHIDFYTKNIFFLEHSGLLRLSTPFYNANQWDNNYSHSKNDNVLPIVFQMY